MTTPPVMPTMTEAELAGRLAEVLRTGKNDLFQEPVDPTALARVLLDLFASLPYAECCGTATAADEPTTVG